jgi:predicted CopG family antitoxin
MRSGVCYTHNAFKEPAMHKRMTITLDEDIYEGLYRTIGKRRMSQFIEDLLRPHVLNTALDDGYRAMAADKVRETEAMEWSNGLIADLADEAR